MTPICRRLSPCKTIYLGLLLGLGLVASRPRSHKCVAVSPLAHAQPPVRRIGLSFSRNSPLLATFRSQFPPSFCFSRARICFLNVLFALLIILKTDPVLTATHPPCFTRGGYVSASGVHFGVHFVHPASLGREGGSQTCPQFHSVIIRAGLCDNLS